MGDVGTIRRVETTANQLSNWLEKQEFRSQCQEMNPFFPEQPYSYVDGEMTASRKKPRLNELHEVAPQAVRAGFISKLAEMKRSEDPAPLTAFLNDLEEKVQISLARLNAVFGLLKEHPEPTQENALAESAKLKSLLDESMTECLKRQRPTERTVRSIALALEEAGDRVKGLYWLNHFAIPSANSDEWGETAVKDWNPADFPGGELPLFQSPLMPTGEYAAITFTDFDERTVWQTKGSLIVLADEFRGLGDMRFFAQPAERSRSIVLGNVREDLVGEEQPDLETFKETIQKEFKHSAEMFKRVAPYLGYQVGRRRSQWEERDITIFPAFIDLGKRLGNDARSDAVFNTPLTNPSDQRLLGSSVISPVSRWLARDRNKFYGAIGLPVLCEVSDVQARGTWSVIHNTRTAHSSEHTIEVQLGEDLAATLVAFHLLHAKGRPTTTAEAKRVGQVLNAILRNRASETRPDLPFLEAKCLWEESTCVPVTLKDADGKEILDADGKPTYTGQWEQVHMIKIKYREGINKFRVIFTS
ncbi:hypothetical protein [Planctopirus hydrillae]|uniref:Uncharacterized protein n=1 Tax=Planctopirus hydrillae TaxID=1841610 RepID=A0A1C3EIT8_9PLAN|nr:hypothetical protein [Planctopirus hydrillae]ODA33147.1 hypothetical protein A6X21_05115 [Planctopirus hydrillae]